MAVLHPSCRSLVVVSVVLGLVGSAAAGVRDSPLPTFPIGTKAKHVFSVPGVMSSGNLETSFQCTSLEKTKPIQWGVEMFLHNGTNPENDISLGQGIRTTTPGHSDTLSTASTDAFIEGVIQGVISDGSARSARIVATSTKLMCTAVVVDPETNPPTVAYDLPVIKKTSQKGD